MSDIVLVHGLWNRGWMMARMAKRLRTRGHHVRVFSYPTRADNLDGHADQLHNFVREQESAKSHLVGHSMGGLVSYIALNELAESKRSSFSTLITISTPWQGHAAAASGVKGDGGTGLCQGIDEIIHESLGA